MDRTIIAAHVLHLIGFGTYNASGVAVRHRWQVGLLNKGRAQVRRQVAVGRVPSVRKRRPQAALGDLVEQRLVADLEAPRGLGAVPAHAVEHFPECLRLGFSRPAASNLPETTLGNGESW